MIQPAFNGTMADAIGALDGFRLPDHIDYPILTPLGKHEVMPGHFRHGLLAVDAAVALLDAARNPRQVEMEEICTMDPEVQTLAGGIGREQNAQRIFARIVLNLPSISLRRGCWLDRQSPRSDRRRDRTRLSGLRQRPWDLMVVDEAHRMSCHHRHAKRHAMRWVVLSLRREARERMWSLPLTKINRLRLLHALSGGGSNMSLSSIELRGASAITGIC